MSTFRDFELGRWNDPSVCSTYHDRLSDLVVQVTEPMLDAVRVGPGDRVLDVATGPGTLAAAAAARGADVVGISEEQLRRARVDHPTLTFEQGEAEALPFRWSTFDVVVSNFGVPHFPDPEGFFGDSWRVLRPGGRFAFSVWATPDQTKAFGAVLGAVERLGSFDVGLPPGPNFFLYADAGLAHESLVAAGFESVAVDTVPQVWEVEAPDDAFVSILGGTARTAALLNRQTPQALAAIRHSQGRRSRPTGPGTVCAGSPCRRSW